MPNFASFAATADTIVLRHFGVPIRWTKESAATVDTRGIIDLEVEMMGPHGDFGYLTKALTAKSSVLRGYRHGEKCQELDDAGTPIGPEYELQKTLSDDGEFITIEITT